MKNVRDATLGSAELTAGNTQRSKLNILGEKADFTEMRGGAKIG